MYRIRVAYVEQNSAQLNGVYMWYDCIKTSSTLNFPLPKIGVPIYHRTPCFTRPAARSLLWVIMWKWSARTCETNVWIRVWMAHYLPIKIQKNWQRLSVSTVQAQKNTHKKRNCKKNYHHAEKCSAFYSHFFVLIFENNLHCSALSLPSTDKSSFWFIYGQWLNLDCPIYTNLCILFYILRWRPNK